MLRELSLARFEFSDFLSSGIELGNGLGSAGGDAVELGGQSPDFYIGLVLSRCLGLGQLAQFLIEAGDLRRQLLTLGLKFGDEALAVGNLFFRCRACSTGISELTLQRFDLVGQRRLQL